MKLCSGWLYCGAEDNLNADDFNLDTLINSMKELRQMQLDDQVRSALSSARLQLDPATLEHIIHELESDIEEHIVRLESISKVLSEDERRNPERMLEARRQEVAFQSGSDFEDVDSLCEAFSRAREILAGLKGQDGAVLDVRLLFGSLPPGLTGIDFGGEGAPSNLLRGILDGSIHSALPTPDLDELVTRNTEFEDLFDLETKASPRNRLPKDWKP